MRMLSSREAMQVCGGYRGVSRETVGCAAGSLADGRVAGPVGAAAGCIGGAPYANNVGIGRPGAGPFGGGPAGMRGFIFWLYSR